MNLILKTSDDKYSFNYTVAEDDGTVVDLTGATTKFRMGNQSKIIFTNPSTVVDAVNGVVSYSFAKEDTMYDGSFIGEFEITFPNGSVLSYPRSGYLAVFIQRSVDSNLPNITLEDIAAKQGDYDAKLNSILQQAGNITMSAMNENSWVATAGKLTYVLPPNAGVDIGNKWFQVYVGGSLIDNSLVSLNLPNQFTLNIPSSIILDGMNVYARWTEPILPITNGHHGTHEQGGQDEIDITKLRNYTEQVSTPLADLVINVKTLGADPTGLNDSTVTIQSAINSLITTGGTVYLPKGTYIVNSPINLSSNIRLLGDGWTNTYIKAGNNANIPTNQGVVQTKDFLPDRNKWDYYSPYPVGLHMGVQLENISIDGNREHLTTGNGLCIYGGKWTLRQVGVINTPEHGIWTEAGLPVSSTSGSDLEDFINMHESFADQVYIANTNKHGWNYRGPNDTYLAYVQVKMAGWAGFYQEDPTSLFSNGGLKIGKLHVYYCDCLHETDGYMIHLTNALADLIYSDTSKKGGVKLMGGDNIKINHIFSLTPNCYNVGDFWGLKIDTPSCIIGQIHDVSTVRNVGTQNGGVVWVTSQGSRALLNSVRSGNNPSGTINSTGVKLEGFGSQIASLSLTNFYLGLDIQANEILVRGDLVTCATGFNYRNTGFGRNNIQLIFQGCTTDYANEVVFSSNDVTSFISDKNTSSYNKMGTTELNRLRMKEVFVAYVATYTPNAQNNNFVHVAPLTGNITIGAPTNPIEGDEITFYFQQDSTGGRTVTWNTVFKTNYSDTGNTASKRYTITFHYDGTVWMQKGNGSGWL